jgi:hypothetical protein
MEQHPKYIQNDYSFVFHLKESLYGLKQAPWAWYVKMDSFLLDTDFFRWHSNPNVYTTKMTNHFNIRVLYVDDLILTGSDPKLLSHVKSNLKKKFEKIDLGHLHYFLGLQILQSKEEFPFLSLSMLVTFFATFAWKNVNQHHLSSNLKSNLLPPLPHPK